jgi:hypothetical protein
MNKLLQNYDIKDSMVTVLREFERVIPPAIVNFLHKHKNIKLILEHNPKTDQIQIAIKKIYSQNVQDVLVLAKEKIGYSREDAAEYFLYAQDEIKSHI